MAILLDSTKEKTIPLIPIRDGVIFPFTEAVLTFGRPRSLATIEAAYSSNRQVVLVMQKNPRLEDPTPSDIYKIGTMVRIEKVLKGENDINALVKGVSRVEILNFEQFEPFFIVKILEIAEEEEESEEIQALSKHLITQMRRAVNMGKSVDFLVFMNIMSGNKPTELSYQIASTLDVKPREKQALLETASSKERLQKITEHLTHEIKVLEIERKIASKTQAKFDKSVKETVLRERLKTIEKELGESEEGREIKELEEKIRKAKMTEEVEEKARKELKRLAQMSHYNPEASYLRTYLDWLIELPWSVKTPNDVAIKKAEKILDEDHYGLQKIKERIVEYLAVMKLKERKKQEKGKEKSESKEQKGVSPTILCFVGPPGVGKTSIGRSIARALERKFVKMSLGGIRDEAEIRGHRRTYVGALPGRIIQGVRQAKTRNPVFMLDEIDKVGTDFRGDPSAALLEALDPEQNFSFSDHYLEVPFDLSDVFFITTCNVLDTIPPALKDRLEVIHFPGYTIEEKFYIGKDFLVKKQLDGHALTPKEVEITDNALKRIIHRYTREAGVRNLEREIATIFRKIARKFAEGRKQKVKVSVTDLQEYLGAAKFLPLLAEKQDETGIAIGLFWTEAGGGILFVEVALMRGKGSLILTGHLGDVMKESCQAAMSYVRSRAQVLHLPEKFYQRLDVHVHVPEGAVPKDGPSAGIAITTALVSALTKTKVKRDVGMTGEVTLRGRVLEIGGIKEKVIAAHQAGLKTVVIPKTNKKDLDDIPKKVKKDLKFVFVDHMDQVLKVALKRPLLQKLITKKEKESLALSTRVPATVTVQ